MAKPIIPNNLIEAYARKEIDRETISKITGIDFFNLSQNLYKRRIKIWDSKKKAMETTEKIINMYKNKKATRSELAQLFNQTLTNIDAKIRCRGIKIWDKRIIKKTKKSEGKYFSLKHYKDHYFFKYNK